MRGVRRMALFLGGSQTPTLTEAVIGWASSTETSVRRRRHEETRKLIPRFLISQPIRIN